MLLTTRPLGVAALALACATSLFAGVASQPPRPKAPEAQHSGQRVDAEGDRARRLSDLELISVPLASRYVAIVPVGEIDKNARAAVRRAWSAQLRLYQLLSAGHEQREPGFVQPRAQPPLSAFDPRSDPNVRRVTFADVLDPDTKGGVRIARYDFEGRMLKDQPSSLLGGGHAGLNAKPVTIDSSDQQLNQKVHDSDDDSDECQNAALDEHTLDYIAQFLALLIGFVVALMGFIMLLTAQGPVGRVIGLILLAFAAWAIATSGVSAQ
jgi:hypothetical protein